MDKNSKEKHGCLLVSFDFEDGTVEDAMYMPVKQYANMTGMSKSTIIRHINKGKIFGAKKDKTGKWLIPIPIFEMKES